MRHPEEDCPAIKVKQKTVKLDAILLKGASDPEIQSLSIGSTLYIGFVFFFYELRKKSALTCSRQRKDTFYIGLGIGIHNFLAHCKQNENQSSPILNGPLYYHAQQQNLAIAVPAPDGRANWLAAKTRTSLKFQ